MGFLFRKKDIDGWPTCRWHAACKHPAAGQVSQGEYAGVVVCEKHASEIPSEYFTWVKDEYRQSLGATKLTS